MPYLPARAQGPTFWLKFSPGTRMPRGAAGKWILRAARLKARARKAEAQGNERNDGRALRLKHRGITII